MDKSNPHCFSSQFIALTLTALLVGFATQAINQPASLKIIDKQQSLHAKIRKSDTLPIFGTVSKFSLLERSGSPFSWKDLSGFVWIADFIYTSCTTECPLMTAGMAHLQQALQNQSQKIRLVSFTVDPETDTPQKLSEYAARFQARPDIWKFLTGPREVLYKLAQKDFRLPVQAIPNSLEKHQKHLSDTSTRQSPQPFLHSQKFVLIDKQMQIRGYYDSTNPEEILRLLKTDIPLLLSAH